VQEFELDVELEQFVEFELNVEIELFVEFGLNVEQLFVELEHNFF